MVYSMTIQLSQTTGAQNERMFNRSVIKCEGKLPRPVSRYHPGIRVQELTSVLDGGNYSASRGGYFTLGEKPSLLTGHPAEQKSPVPVGF